MCIPKVMTMMKVKNPRNLDYHVLDGSHELESVDAVGLEVSEQGAERPLVTLVLLVGVVALDVVGGVLVDAVVAEVHARVPQVLAGGIVPDFEERSDMTFDYSDGLMVCS